MKYLVLLFLLPLVAIASPGDTLIEYKSATNTTTLRTLPDSNQDRIYYFSNTTNRPELLTIGENLNLTSGVLSAVITVPDHEHEPPPPPVINWPDIQNKPVWTGVFDGSYQSLTGIPDPTPPTYYWHQILERPATFPASAHMHSVENLNDATVVGRDFMTATSWAWVRSVLSDDLWAWMDSFDGSYDSLTGKPVIPDSLSQMTNDAGYIVTADPRLKVSYSTRAQTDSNGDYTFTFPAEFGSTPKISLAVESGSADYFTAQITSVSTTAVSVKVKRTSAVTVLSVSVLGVQSPAQTYVHITATE